MKKISKWRIELIPRLGFVFIVIMCSACTPAVLQSASTVTATSTPTALPTSTATPDPFAGWNTCYTWRDAKENCVVSYEDLMSGKLVDYARKVTKPFPDDAYTLKLNPVGNVTGSCYYFVPLLEEGLTLDDKTIQQLYVNNNNGYNVNNDTFAGPKSPVGEKLLFWVKGDGTSNLNFDVLAEVVKVKNRDNTDGYYTVIHYPSLQPDGTVDEVHTDMHYDDIFDLQAYQPPCRSTAFDQAGQMVARFELAGTFMLRIANDEISQALLDQWQETGIVPKDLEERPLVADFSTRPTSPVLK